MEVQIKDIPGFPGYKITSDGRVISYLNKRGIEERILKPSLQNHGYLFVVLHCGDKHYNKTIHRLVAQAFVANPKDLNQVNHINGIKSDNRAENMEWTNNYGNSIHKRDNGMQLRCKINMDIANQIRQIYRKGGLYSLTTVGEMFGIHFSQVGRIVNNKIWTVEEIK